MSPAPRRTQEERREETRRKLLDATIESLVDGGIPATTGRRVAELAGVSRGAQTHHFPHVAELITEAIEHLADRRVATMRRRTRRIHETDDPAGTLVDILHEDFTSDLFRAVLKLWVAASDDPDLRRHLEPLERHLRDVSGAFLRDAIQQLGAPEDLAPELELVLHAVRGVAVAELFEPQLDGRRIDAWSTVRPLLVETLSQAADRR
jgi:DNA-binding transcriptional regulator YbjK